MSSVQIHLALTHVPVVLCLAGLVILIAGFISKTPAYTKAAYFLIVAAGVMAIPVFFTGEGTEEAVEHLPGVSEPLIGQHEAVARFAMIGITVAATAALLGLILFHRLKAAAIMKTITLFLVLVSTGLMVQTAHLGGQIRHTEIRSSSAAINQADSTGNMKGSMKDDDDD